MSRLDIWIYSYTRYTTLIDLACMLREYGTCLSITGMS